MDMTLTRTTNKAARLIAAKVEGSTQETLSLDDMTQIVCYVQLAIDGKDEIISLLPENVED